PAGKRNPDWLRDGPHLYPPLLHYLLEGGVKPLVRELARRQSFRKVLERLPRLRGKELRRGLLVESNLVRVEVSDRIHYIQKRLRPLPELLYDHLQLPSGLGVDSPFPQHWQDERRYLPCGPVPYIPPVEPVELLHVKDGC